MGEHQSHDPTGLENTTTFLKNPSHPLLIVSTRKCFCTFLPGKLGRVRNSFVVLVRQLAREEFGYDVSGCTFQPNIEKV